MNLDICKVFKTLLISLFLTILLLVALFLFTELMHLGLDYTEILANNLYNVSSTIKIIVIIIGTTLSIGLWAIFSFIVGYIYGSKIGDIWNL